MHYQKKAAMQNAYFLRLFKIKKGFGEKESSYLRNFE